MTNLEFIEDEIKVLTKRIKELKEEEDLHWNYEHEDEAIECDFQREEYEERLNIFQQIKAELEAWKVVKRYIDLNEEYKFWQTKPNYNSCSLEEYQTVKKALEVKEC